MSVAKHNRKNRKGKITRPHKVWKKRQNIVKALTKWANSPKRENKHNSVNPPVQVSDIPSKAIKSNFELDPDIYTGGESK